MPVRARIGIKGRGILNNIAHLRQLNSALVKAALLATGTTVKRAVEQSAIVQEPGPPKYPIRWKSEKQRRAFFATDGFGGGIPYKRTHQLVAAWKVEVIARRDESVLIIENEANAAQYVYGPDQQPFHADTGWPELKKSKRDRSGFTEFDTLARNEFEENYLGALEAMIYGGR